MVDKKPILDQLYFSKYKMSNEARLENEKSYQLPTDKIADRNLAAGIVRGLEAGMKEIDKVISAVINL